MRNDDDSLLLVNSDLVAGRAGRWRGVVAVVGFGRMYGCMVWEGSGGTA